MDAPVHYASTPDGYSIAYTAEGSGRPFVIVPGFWNDLRLRANVSIGMHVFFDEQETRYRLVHFDPRGEGMSSRGLRQNHSVSDYVYDLEAVVDRLGLDRFVLMGYHTTPAAEYAVKHPERVEALILRNARIDVSSNPVTMLAGIASQSWDAFLDTMVRTIYRATDTVSAKALLRETMTEADWRIAARTISASGIGELAARIQAPTLLLAASNKAWSFGTEEAGQRLATLIPDARLALFDDASAGAWSHGEAPAAVPVIEAFLREIDQRAESHSHADSTSSSSGLSMREIEVLRLIAAGRSNAQIAEALVISPNTVGRHVSNIFDKIGAANRAEATAYALRNGLA